MTANRLIAIVIGVSIAAACGTGSPSPSAAEMTDFLQALVLRGATIHEQVGGDAGCADSTLYGNALRLELTLAQDGNDYEVFVFRWRRPADFDASAERFGDCLEEFASGISGDANVESVEVRPWRAFGPGWSPELQTTLEQAIRATGGA